MDFLVPDQLETKRLRLRQFHSDDWQDLHRYYGSDVATKYTMGRVLSEGETWRTLSGMVGHWHLRGYGPYAVEEKSSGRVLGTVGFWYPFDWPSPEIKWALAPQYWGKGFASEAARAVQAAGLEHLPDIALISFIHRDNQASLRLAQAIGATFESERLFRGERWHVYRHPPRSSITRSSINSR